MIKVRKSLLISLFCCFSLLCSLAVISFIENTKLLKANAVYSEDIVMVNGASIRLDANRNGIRFATFIPDSYVNSEYFSNYEIGTLFIPKMYLLENESLEHNRTYQGKSPVSAKFDGNIGRLIVDDSFPGGRLFNTVLELTAHTDKAVALNGVIVARSYIKNRADNSITYLNAVERAPAFVAFKGIEAGEESDTLDSYVQHIFGEVINMSVGQAIEPSLVVGGLEDVAVTVSDIPPAESLVSGLAKNDELNEQGAGELELAKIEENQIVGVLEGITTVRLSVLGGKLTKTLTLVIANPQVVFYSSGYKPSGSFTIPIKNASKLEIESDSEKVDAVIPKTPLEKTIIEDSLYSESGGVVNLSKFDLLGSNVSVQGDYILTVTTFDNRVSYVPIYVRSAIDVDFEDDGNDLIGELIFLEGHFVNLNPALRVKVWSGTDENSGGWGYYYDIPKITSEGYGYFSINTEYILALSSANPSMDIKYVWTMAGNTERNVECGYNKEMKSGKWTTATIKVSLEYAKYTSLSRASIAQLTESDYNFEIKIPLSGSAHGIRLFKIYAGA